MHNTIFIATCFAKGKCTDPTIGVTHMCTMLEPPPINAGLVLRGLETKLPVCSHTPHTVQNTVIMQVTLYGVTTAGICKALSSVRHDIDFPIPFCLEFHKPTSHCECTDGWSLLIYSLSYLSLLWSQRLN